MARLWHVVRGDPVGALEGILNLTLGIAEIGYCGGRGQRKVGVAHGIAAPLQPVARSVVSNPALGAVLLRAGFGQGAQQHDPDRGMIPF